MSGWVEVSKPAAAARVHLMMAWSMWALVGATLMAIGARWLWRAAPQDGLWLTGLALTIGSLKARFVLDRVAQKIIERIRQRGDGRCLGGFLSFRSWFFVAIMAGGGRFLRSSHLARGWLGILYLAVGSALLFSSRVAWRAWRVQGREKTVSPASCQ